MKLHIGYRAHLIDAKTNVSPLRTQVFKLRQDAVDDLHNALTEDPDKYFILAAPLDRKFIQVRKVFVNVVQPNE